MDHLTIIKCLENQGTMLYPTDTIWGLGCDATSDIAVQKIFKLKNRADEKSLIVLVKDSEMLQKYTDLDLTPFKSIIESTTKPTTFIIQKAKNLSQYAMANDGSIAFRIPNHAFCQSILNQFNKPIISTSANISGAPSPLNFKSIDSIISSNVDCIAEEKHDTSTYTKPSTILKLNMDGTTDIIRE